jgi:hypothetical protein
MAPRSLVAIVAVAALLVPAAAAVAAPPPAFFGVTYDRAAASAPPPLQSEQFRLMRRSGVGAVRTVFSWAHAQPERGGAIDFTRTDAVVADAAASEIELLPIVMYAPEWARTSPDRGASPPRDPADYSAYLGQLVDRYGPRGSFWAEHPELPAQPLRAWQIWNEPHLPWQWDLGDAGGSWPRDYTALLERAHATVKRHDRGARVVLAGLTNASWRALGRLYRAGARGSFDVAAMHVYTGSVARALQIVRLFRRVMRYHHDGRTPVWMTEVSWPAARGKVDPGLGFRSVITTDRGMASRLAGLYREALRVRRTLNLRRVYWYSWGTSYAGREESFDYAGLGSYSDGVFTPMPALGAFSRIATGSPR